VNPLVFLLPAALAAPSFEDGVVTLKVTWQAWEVGQPWVKTNPTMRVAQAVVVEGSPTPALLTTAQMVAFATHIRASKHGEPGESPARVLYEDREANLALVAVDDPSFFDDLDPVRFARRPGLSGEVWITRWRENQFETSRGRVSRAVVADSATGVLKYAALRVQTDIQGGGWSEPVFAGGSWPAWPPASRSRTCRWCRRAFSTSGSRRCRSPAACVPGPARWGPSSRRSDPRPWRAGWGSTPPGDPGAPRLPGGKRLRRAPQGRRAARHRWLRDRR